MAKINKEDNARREGMAYALRIAEEKGIEGLRADLEYRNAVGLPVGISRKQLNEFVEETKNTMLDTVLLMSCYVLHDFFGFGKNRLSKFKGGFNDYAESLSMDLMSWQDIAEGMQEETGLEFHIRSDEEKLKC